MQIKRHKHLQVMVVALLLGACGAAAMVVALVLEGSSVAQAADLSLAGGGHATASAVRPAEWQTFDILVDFQNLPRTYSCDDLWYKFRDVLQKLGARAYMTITPYHCGYVGGGRARSPRVEVKFQLPRPLHGADIRYAQMSVVDKSVRLSPGSPRSLDSQDCEFAKQLDNTFFPALPVRVETADFRCSAAKPYYALVVNARIKAPASSAPTLSRVAASWH
jgi:hypothetical protein